MLKTLISTLRAHMDEKRKGMLAQIEARAFI